MKRICILFIMICWALISINAQSSPVRICTEDEIPTSQRKLFLRVAKNFLEYYYNNLFLNVNDNIVQESFIQNYMIKGSQRYKPEFPLNIPEESQYLMPEQYLQELSKQFKAENIGDWILEISDITFENAFMATNNLDCFVTTHYTLTLYNGENTLYSRTCSALCYWPQSRMYDQVLLMQVEPDNNLDIKNQEDKASSNQDTTDNIMSMEDVTLKAIFHVLSKKTKRELSISHGIEVLSVFEGKLKEAGVKKGFIITHANAKDITGLKMFEQIINEAKNSTEKVLFLKGIYPSGKRAYLAVDVNP